MCIECKSVYFCNNKCRKYSWNIHKNHCGRDLFTICIVSDDTKLKCDKCPVKFCSHDHRNSIINTHINHDCEYFSKTFN